LRALGQASSVVCEGCGSILDAKDPKLQIIQTFHRIVSSDPPLIPLGTRGKIRGTDYEVIGLERRTINVDLVDYHWHEYILFNPYKGFRYLTEFQGHWNDISICKELPSMNSNFNISPEVNYLGESYRHFQTADANTDFVLGEFPWQVRLGERAIVTDYVHPPQVLSREKMAGEVTWSIGEYIPGRDLWQAFNLPGSPPPAIGVYENEPSPFSANLKAVWIGFATLAFGLLVMMIAFDIFAMNSSVFRGSYRFTSGDPRAEASFVSNTFQLDGRTSNVEVATSADLQNNWIKILGRLGILPVRSVFILAMIATALGRKAVGALPSSCHPYLPASTICVSSRKLIRCIHQSPTPWKYGGMYLSVVFTELASWPC
jgi:hypothetical protein